jgi:hypothetical protein
LAANSICINSTGADATTADDGEILIKSDEAQIQYNTANGFTFTEGAGVARLDPAAGVYIFPNLPTSDPAVAGQLWNDAGTLKVSAG